ncbi:membrane protein insertase YidC [Nocardioidaceae bacterium]|nr:membrane protein insertase YidC [Nocardioidaceae bacterium]
MSLLDPLSHALAQTLHLAHAGLTALGPDPASGLVWTASVAVLVVTVRLLLLPFAVHGVRTAHAAARARPQLRALAETYRERQDPASVRAYAEERRRVAAEHRLSPWGCLPVLVQVPIWFALFHLLSDLAAGTPVGAVDTGLVASFGAATLVGVPLAQHGYAGLDVTHLAVIAGLAAAAATLSFVTQRFLVLPNAVPYDGGTVMTQVLQAMPLLSAVALLVTSAFVPVALLVYWVVNSSWTLLQTAVVVRWWPTPGSPAAQRAALRRRAA